MGGATRVFFALALPPLGGCEVRGAPSLVLFGAYFPAWMLCALAGVVAGVVAHFLFALSRLDEIVQQQLLVCASLGLLVAVVVWFSMFGHYS